MAHLHTHHGLTTDNAKLMRIASYCSVAVASFLLAAKIYAWWETDSLSMLSSLIDSAFDLVMSLANMLALRYALKPADDDHRFGHTSIEDIASLAQCAFIAASMSLIVLQSFERLANPRPLSHEELGIAVTLIALVLTSGLVTFQTYVTRRASSLIVASDRLHYVGDILFNIGVLVAFAFSMWGGIAIADPLIAILIAGVILYNTKPTAIRAFNNLMDREMPDEEKERIYAIVRSMPEIRSYHKLKTRYAGLKCFIQMHVEIDASLNFRDAHAITDRLEKAVESAFPAAEVIIHPDPVD